MNAYLAKKIRKTGTFWYVVVSETDYTGKQKKTWHTDPKTGKGFIKRGLAKKHMADLLSSSNKGNYVSPNKLLFADLLDDFLSTKKMEVTESTFVKYEQLVRVHIKPNLGNIPAQKLTTQHLNACYAKLLEVGKQTNHKGGQGLAAKSVRHIHVLVNATLEQAVKHDLLVKNVAQNAIVPKSANKKMTIFTVSELNTFLEGIQGTEFETLFNFYARTGCRRGEALGLTWRNVDWINSTVTIEQSLDRIHGKAYISQPKTKNSFRTFEIDRELLKALDQIAIQQQKSKMQLGSGYTDSDFVFCEPNGQWLNPNRIYNHFISLRDKLGLPNSVRLHDLRGTHITMLLASGTNPKYVAERVGDSVETIMEFYAQTYAMEGSAALNRLEQMLNENKEFPNKLRSA